MMRDLILKHRQFLRHGAMAVLVCLGLGMAAPTALGHAFRDRTKCKNDAALYCAKEWYFYGAVRKGEARDPVNVIFRGGFVQSRNGPPCYGDLESSAFCARYHVVDHWDGMKSGVGTSCNSGATLTWRHFDRNNPTSPVNRADGATTKRPPCIEQFHIRLWHDHEHVGTPGHDDANEMAVGAIHHERREGVKHSIDKDWTDVRAFLRRKMRDHCMRRRWAVHPGARSFQNHENDKILLRISWSQRSGVNGVSTCKGQ